MSEQAASDTISVFGLEDSGDRGLIFNRAEARYQRRAISAADLEQHLADFINKMGGVISVVPDMLGAFHVDEVTLSAEISAKGSVSLMGTGGELGGQGGITITLKRTPSPAVPGHE